MKSLSRYRYWPILMLILLYSTNVVVSNGSPSYQFDNLSDYYNEDLFGLRFDYNSFNRNLDLLTDLISSEQFSTNDSDLQEDNILSLISQKYHGISTAIMAIEKVGRTQEIFGFDTPIKYQTPLPFMKLVNHYTLPQGFDVVSSLDILGIALKIDEENYNPATYQLGYANLPMDLINLIIGYGTDIQTVNTAMNVGNIFTEFPYNPSINIQEKKDSFQVDVIYSNVTFLFQTEGIGFFEFEIGSNLLFLQFETLAFTFSVSKYVLNKENGVESRVKVNVGKILTLIINEDLPEGTWINAFDFRVEENLFGLLEINDTFSYYTGSDISHRLTLFDSLTFSLITSQSLGLLNGTKTLEGIEVYIDARNTSKAELGAQNFLITEEVSLLFNEAPLFTSYINGREFAIENPANNPTLLPMNSFSIALNQQTGFAGNLLFRQETSIVRDIVTECIQHYSENNQIKDLTPDQLYDITGLYLQSAKYFRDSGVINWTGNPISFQLLDVLHATTSESFFNGEHSQITSISFFPSFLVLLLISLKIRKRRKL